MWCTDVTYLPLQRGFLSLVAVMDWASRTVRSWRLSNTLDASFCVEALHEALERYGPAVNFHSAKTDLCLPAFNTSPLSRIHGASGGDGGARATGPAKKPSAKQGKKKTK